MENNIDVIRKSVELSDTVIDGLQHIQSLLFRGMNTEAIHLFEDVLYAYITIERSIRQILENLAIQNPVKSITSIKVTIDIIISSFEQNRYEDVDSVIESELIPQFKNLKKEFEFTFYSYLNS